MFRFRYRYFNRLLGGKKEAVDYIEKNKGFLLKTTIINLFELYYGAPLRGRIYNRIESDRSDSKREWLYNSYGKCETPY